MIAAQHLFFHRKISIGKLACLLPKKSIPKTVCLFNLRQCTGYVERMKPAIWTLDCMQKSHFGRGNVKRKKLSLHLREKNNSTRLSVLYNVSESRNVKSWMRFHHLKRVFSIYLIQSLFQCRLRYNVCLDDPHLSISKFTTVLCTS